MMAELYYALGRRLAMEEELQKHAGILDPEPILESALGKRLLPALAMGALIGAPAGVLAARGSIDPKSVRGPLWNMLPPTKTQLDMEREWRMGHGALLGLLLGGGLGAMAPEWGPLLTKSTQTLGKAIL